ncbi:MAG: DNA ligase [Gammaproteobacteria bacterium]|nr:DNA ligase [Gammaproteobacteria bacterium]
MKESALSRACPGMQPLDSLTGGRRMRNKPLRTDLSPRAPATSPGEPGIPGLHRFIVQRHPGSPWHYDLRLEIGDVMVSWAVPKGVSTEPDDRRLAIQTGDQPLDQSVFRGPLPTSDNTDAAVLVWDTGHYRNLRRDGCSMRQSVQDGLVQVWLEGGKLQGGYALKRTYRGRHPGWQLFKLDDTAA